MAKKKAVPKRKPAANVTLQSERDAAPSGVSRFPIVGLGASAGGLEALQTFLDAMPQDSGLAFVVLTHQHLGHVSMLAELLAAHTQMPVTEITEGITVAPNHVYVNPPGGNPKLINLKLYLSVETDAAIDNTKLKLPIDRFFRSLAEDQGERAICVVLSGTGSDGTLGLKAIKAASGFAIVQEPSSAKFDGMPTSAIGIGLADFVLPPGEMPAQLMLHAQTPLPATVEATDPLSDETLRKILELLRTRIGHDFSSYKTTTIRRRIARRMAIQKIEGPNEYIELLQHNADEIDILFKGLLISVTRFFRDAEAWKVLGERELCKLVESRPENYSFRAWVAGCATGEEAYTLAILLREVTERSDRHFDFQIFATDLDSAVIDVARAGVYPDSIAADVSPLRLSRYFISEDSNYRVRNEVREMCVFAPQSVYKDPPFTKLDLICCRNLLIYLDSDKQSMLLPIFHYALKPGGLLMLGPSESLGQHDDLFETVDKTWKIYVRKETVPDRPLPDLPARLPSTAGELVRDVTPAMSVLVTDPKMEAMVDRLLLVRYVPASLVVNERGDILHIHGRIGAFFEPMPGRPRMNAIEMAREGLRAELHASLRQAATQDAEVRRHNIPVRTESGHLAIDCIVSKIAHPKPLRGLFLISLRPTTETPLDPTSQTQKRDRGKGGRVRDLSPLERELHHAKESLQTANEELEASNEEMKSTNEELQSTNEELQSSNEELETSKEEMQSLNEELNTVNAEVQGKLFELAHVNDDLHNLLNSTEVASLFLDKQLSIKSYTHSASELLKAIPSDVGRNINDLKTKFVYETLVEDARKVLRTLNTKEANVESTDGRIFLMRMMPYRTLENVIDGLVITFTDVTQLRVAEELFANVFETIREPMLVLDDSFRVVKCNASFYRTFELVEHQVLGKSIYAASGNAWDNAVLRSLLEEVLPHEMAVENFDYTHIFHRLGEKRFLINARRLLRASGLPAMILLAMEDVTEKVKD